MLQAGARLCKCLGEEFLPYMNVVMPPLLASAQLKPDVNVADNDSDAEETDDDEVKLRLPRTTLKATILAVAQLEPAPRCVVQNPLVAPDSLHLCVWDCLPVLLGASIDYKMLTSTVTLRLIMFMRLHSFLHVSAAPLQVETIYMGDRRVSIRTTVLEEKATACNMLCCYADELKEGFYPYVAEVWPHPSVCTDLRVYPAFSRLCMSPAPKSPQHQRRPPRLLRQN